MHLTLPNPSRYSALLAWFTSRPTRSSLLFSPRRNLAFLFFFTCGPRINRQRRRQRRWRRTASIPPPFVRSRRPLFPRCYYLCTMRGTRHSIIFSSIFTHPFPAHPYIPQVQGRGRRGAAVPASGKLRSGRAARFARRTCRCNRG